MTFLCLIIDKLACHGTITFAMNPIVRICSIDIENIKNVLGGTIPMPHRVAGFNPAEGEVLGLYGQNGTGKTAVVNALSLVQTLIRGKALPEDAAAWMTCGKTESRVSILFNVETELRCFDVQYTVTLARGDEGVYIRNEALSAKPIEPKARFSTIIEFNEESVPASGVLAPQATLAKLQSHCSKQDILINKVLANREGRSYIFNEWMLACLLHLEGGYAEILRAVHHFAALHLYIVSTFKSSLVKGDLLPITVTCGNGPEMMDTCLVFLNGPSSLPASSYHDFKGSLEQINRVLCKIIPGLTLVVKEVGAELETADAENVRFELLAIRGDSRIPLKYESDGIKKIIAILLLWITSSNTPGTCLVVDELDASIFEYLLGELLSVWKENARGQLIFTAHNLHPLEVLDKRSVVFTTIDPHHRFIRFKNIKPTNNLRDVYLRSIFIGGQEFELYDETSKTDIARAIRQCASPCK